MTVFVGVVPLGALALRLTVGLVLLTAGVAKLSPGSDVRAEIERYKLLPTVLLPLTARALPVLELLAGAALLTGLFTRIAAATAGMLFGAFTIGIAVNLVRGRRIDCGCHGLLGEVPISRSLVARTTTLTAAAVTLAVLPSVAVALPDAIATTIVVIVVLCATRIAHLITELRHQRDRLAAVTIREST